MFYQIFFLAIGPSFLTSLFCRNIAISMIREIGINERYYPRSYSDIPRWIRKIFNLKKQKILKIVLFELYMSLFSAILGPVNAIIIVCAAGNENIIRVVVVFFISMLGIFEILFIVMYFYYKRRRPN